MVNKSVNEFYTRFLFKIYALPPYVLFPLDIPATFFKKLIPDITEFLISEGVQVPTRPPTENNFQENRGSFWSEMQLWKQKIKQEQ